MSVTVSDSQPLRDYREWLDARYPPEDPFWAALASDALTAEQRRDLQRLKRDVEVRARLGQAGLIAEGTTAYGMFADTLGRLPAKPAFSGRFGGRPERMLLHWLREHPGTQRCPSAAELRDWCAQLMVTYGHGGFDDSVWGDQSFEEYAEDFLHIFLRRDRLRDMNGVIAGVRAAAADWLAEELETCSMPDWGSIADRIARRAQRQLSEVAYDRCVRTLSSLELFEKLAGARIDTFSFRERRRVYKALEKVTDVTRLLDFDSFADCCEQYRRAPKMTTQMSLKVDGTWRSPTAHWEHGPVLDAAFYLLDRLQHQVCARAGLARKGESYAMNLSVPHRRAASSHLW